MQGVGSDVLTSFYKADLVQSGAVRAAARGVRTWPNGTLLPHALGFTGRSRQSSGPLPGGAALRWMLSSGRAVGGRL